MQQRLLGVGVPRGWTKELDPIQGSRISKPDRGYKRMGNPTDSSLSNPDHPKPEPEKNGASAVGSDRRWSLRPWSR